MCDSSFFHRIPNAVKERSQSFSYSSFCCFLALILLEIAPIASRSASPSKTSFPAIFYAPYFY